MLYALLLCVCLASVHEEVAKARSAIDILVYAYGSSLMYLNFVNIQNPSLGDFSHLRNDQSKWPKGSGADFMKRKLPWIKSADGQSAVEAAVRIKAVLGDTFYHASPTFRLLLLYKFNMVPLERLSLLSSLPSIPLLSSQVDQILGALKWIEMEPNCTSMFQSIVKALVNYLLEKLYPSYYIHLPIESTVNRGFLRLYPLLSHKSWKHTKWSLFQRKNEQDWVEVASGSPRRNNIVRELITWLLKFDRFDFGACPANLKRDPLGAATLIRLRLDARVEHQGAGNSLISLAKDSIDPETTRMKIALQLLNNVNASFFAALDQVMPSQDQFKFMYRLVVSWDHWPADWYEGRLELGKKLLVGHFQRNLTEEEETSARISHWLRVAKVGDLLAGLNRELAKEEEAEELDELTDADMFSRFSLGTLGSILHSTIFGDDEEEADYSINEGVLKRAHCLIEKISQREEAQHYLKILTKVNQLLNKPHQAECLIIRNSRFLNIIDLDLLSTPTDNKNSSRTALMGPEGTIIIKVLLFLEGHIDRRQLLSDLSFDYFQLDVYATMTWFEDAILPCLPQNWEAVLSGGFPIAPDRIILASLWKLRQMRPSFCPIADSEIEELLELFLVHMAASYFMNKGGPINELIIDAMKDGDRRILPGGTNDHSISVDIRKLKTHYEVTVMNSGEGLTSHDRQGDRCIYYQKYHLDWEGLKRRNFYYTQLAGRNVAGTLFLGPEGKQKLDTLTELVTGQKSGICFSRAARYALKFYLGKMRYDWLKTYILAERFAQIKQSLQSVKEPIPFDFYDLLSWDLPGDLPIVCKFEPTMGLVLPVERHTVIRYLGVALNCKDPDMRADMLRMLRDLPKDSVLDTCFKVYT